MRIIFIQLPASAWSRVILILMQCYRLNLMGDNAFGSVLNDHAGILLFHALFQKGAQSLRNSCLKIKGNSRRARFMFKENADNSKQTSGFFNSISKLFIPSYDVNIEPITLYLIYIYIYLIQRFLHERTSSSSKRL